MPITKKTKQQELKKDIGEKIHSICTELDIPNPLEFTIQVMAGKDPRPISKHHQSIVDILEDIGDAPPGKLKWRRLKRLVDAMVTMKTTPMAMSTKAAQQLLEYSFAKKKADSEDPGLSAQQVEVKPLSIKEIKMFEKKFKIEF